MVCACISTFIELLSLECRWVIGFASLPLHDWLKKLAPLFHPIRSKTKTKLDARGHIFPRFASATCNLSFDWFTGLSVSFVIGQNDCFGFMILSWKTFCEPAWVIVLHLLIFMQVAVFKYLWAWCVPNSHLYDLTNQLFPEANFI